MALCFDAVNNRYEYCTSHLSTYIAVGVIIPLAILLIIVLVYIYFRCRQRQSRRAHQPTYMATIIPIYNSDQHQQGPYDYPYPPHYTSMSIVGFDKPPSYEQTIQEISEATIPPPPPPRDSMVNPSAVYPSVTPMSSTDEPVQSTR